jgi:hypothetical protein
VRPSDAATEFDPTPGTDWSMIDIGLCAAADPIAPEVRLMSPERGTALEATGRKEAGSGVARDSSGSRPAGE